MFGGMAPEVISGIIYAGPGNSSLMTAAQEWSGLAEQMEAQVLDTRAIVSGLDAAWQGPSAQAMTAAVQGFLTWMEGSATAARQSAQAATGAASAFGQVLASVVPPPLIAANRSQLLMLVATNLLGQNTSAIAALEAQYEAMWAQDEAAMNTYQASSSASIGQLPTFSPAPQVATPAAAVVAPAATDPVGTTIADLEALLNGPIYELFLALLGAGFPVDIIQLFSSFFGPFLGSAVVAGMIGQQTSVIAGKPNAVVTPAPGSPAKSVPPVRASSGSAARIGPMRVPPSWAQPVLPKTATPLPPDGGQGQKERSIGLPVIPAVPVVAAGKAKKKRSGYSDPDDMHYGAPTTPILNRHPSGG